MQHANIHPNVDLTSKIFFAAENDYCQKYSYIQGKLRIIVIIVKNTHMSNINCYSYQGMVKLS